MAITERLAIVLEAQGANTVVRDFDRVGRSAKGVGFDAKAGAKGLDGLAVSGLASSSALKAGVAAAASLAGAKLVSFAQDAVAAAAAVEEQVSGAKVTFGEASDAVVEFADKSSGALGLSRSEALSAANAFGGLFKAAGATPESAGAASVSLVRLAADLASFKDVAGGVPVVLQKLESGLAGEAEPLRSLGIFLNETSVKAKAAELGLGGTNRELTDGEKIAARYALILEQTTDAQGDMARTGDSLANQQRKLTADIKRVQEELGAALVPATRDAVLAFRGLISVGRDAGEVLGWLNTKVEDLSGGMANLGLVARVSAAVTLGPVAEFVRWLIKEGKEADETGGSLGGLTKILELGAEVHREAADDVENLTDALLATPAAQRAYEAATRAVGAAERTVTEARKEYNKLLEQGAVDEEKVADARRSLGEATRSLASAQRDLRNAQEEYNDAQAAFLALPTDTNADKLSDANDNLADAQDGVASAAEREQAAQRDLARAQAGDPEFNDKLAAAKWRVTDAEIALADAQYNSAQRAFELEAALTKQNTLLTNNATAIGTIRAEWEALLARRPEIAAFLAGPAGALLGAPPATAPPPAPGPVPQGPGDYGGGGDFADNKGGGVAGTVRTVGDIIINVKDAVTDPAGLARRIVWELW